VLIFVTKKANSEELAGKLKTKDFEGLFSAFAMLFCQQYLGVASEENSPHFLIVASLQRNRLCLLAAGTFNGVNGTLISQNAFPEMK